jgi:hypothetical protein
MAQLHFANLVPSANKASLLSVLSDTHKFTNNEAMQAHIEYYGSIDGWAYPFSLVIITDKTHTELQHLLEDVYLSPSDEYVRKYTFLEPALNTPDYLTLKSTGQIELTFAEFEQYMRLT